jgi:GntR family transcriptional regulator, transcriptional repressor for pyruvate dehydrogenase complex
VENVLLPFENVRPRRAVDGIVEQIRARIQSQELTPGQKLPNERDLAQQLGVSRNTVREALRMLEVSGLVTLKTGSQGGAFLNASNTVALSQNLIDGIALRRFGFSELVDVRLALESYLVERACEHASDEEIEELATLARESEVAESGEPDYGRRLTLHMEFHRKLSHLAHNAVAETLTEPLLEITRRLHLKAGPAGGTDTHINRAQLVQALRNRDPVAGKAALARHLEVLQRRILAGTSDI